MLRTVAYAVVVAAGFIALGTNAASASSVLVDQGDTTYDPTTGLEWLDLTPTMGLSYNQVEHNAGVNYIAGGWTYATTAQVESLFTDAGGVFSAAFPEQNGAQATTDAANLIALMSGAGTEIDGWERDNGVLSLSTAIAAPGSGAYYFVAQTGFTDDTSASEFGSFLVKNAPVSPAPIPATLPLFISAIGGLGFLGWRHRRGALR